MQLRCRSLVALAALVAVAVVAGPVARSGEQAASSVPFRAGAFAIDITPSSFPIAVNGGFQPRYAEKVHDPLHARCLVLDDGRIQVAVAVVDSCVLDRSICDQAKQLAGALTQIPASRIFISATHTHSAPAVVGALGTEPDEPYRRLLPGKIAEGIERAQRNLAAAEIGWAVGALPGVPQSRRWIARPDKIRQDPFGEMTTRATMHPGYRHPDWQEPSGPMVPDLPVIAVRRTDGQPIALLASFSIHYVGAPVLSADYFGVFARRIGELIGSGASDRPLVGMLANGVSGDAYLRDYSREEPEKFDMHSIGESVAQEAAATYRRLVWHDTLPLDVAETELELAMRPAKLEWARTIMDPIRQEGRPLQSQADFYAREQLLLAEMPPTRKLKLQAVRIGTLAMVGIPCEVFAITGLRIRSASPFEYTFTVMLANGWDGYLPPPEQLVMGGYTTWLARSSCLEPQAEPKIRGCVAKLLDRASGGYRAERRRVPPSPYAAAVLASQPAVYWRLDDLEGPAALDTVSGAGRGTFETQVAYYLPGPQSPAFSGFEAENRAPHFVGQRLAARLPGLSRSYSVEFWFYNCMPTDARDVTGYLFSRGAGSAADCLAIGGRSSASGKLVFHTGSDAKSRLCGTTGIPLRNWVPRESWHHVGLVRDGARVTVYLDGRAQPEISGEAAPPPDAEEVFVAGQSDGQFSFEGRVDEVAIYARALRAEEVRQHYRAAVAE